MKRLSLVLFAAAAAAPALAQSSAQADPVLVELARVHSSTPVYADVQVPRTECTTQTVAAETPAPHDKRNLVGAGLGAVAGGLVGHTVGGGDGKTAATAVGAVAGALVGNDLAKRSANGQAYRDTRARLLRRGREVCHVTAELMQESRLVASAVATCLIVPIRC